MRLLFLQSVPYGPEARGASRSTWFLVEELAKRGHLCAVAAPSLSLPTIGQWVQCSEGGFDTPTVHASLYGVETHQLGPVTAFICKNPFDLAASVSGQIREFGPDWVLVSSEYPKQMILLTAALNACTERVIYLAHATQLLPFGPKSYAASDAGMDMLGKVAGIITVSHYLKDYIRRWAGLDASVRMFPVFGQPPYPQLGSFDRGSVMFINPCAYKGISIFESLARALPKVPFIAVPSWGTTSADRQTLQSLSNVQIVEPMNDLDRLYAHARIILVPSLGEEAFGYVATEAMLRGIPVLASDLGGLPEAKLEVDYILPVAPIECYENCFDERKNPVPVIPRQDIQPWLQALHRLLSDRDHYEQLSRLSSRSAQAFVAGIGAVPYEEFLNGLSAKTPRPISSEVALPKPEESGKRADLTGLSLEKRALIAALLKNKRQEGIHK